MRAQPLETIGHAAGPSLRCGPGCLSGVARVRFMSVGPFGRAVDQNDPAIG